MWTKSICNCNFGKELKFLILALRRTRPMPRLEPCDYVTKTYIALRSNVLRWCICSCWPMATPSCARANLVVIWLSLSTFLTTGADAQAISFRPLAAANGSTLCAVNGPTSSISVCDIHGLTAGVPDEVGCAFQCTGLNVTGAGCTAFNYVDNGTSGEMCHFYRYRPSRCVVGSPGCLHYEVNIHYSLFWSLTCSDEKINFV